MCLRFVRESSGGLANDAPDRAEAAHDTVQPVLLVVEGEAGGSVGGGVRPPVLPQPGVLCPFHGDGANTGTEVVGTWGLSEEERVSILPR